MIGRTLGHYQVGEQLGRGGMGEVYLADDISLGRKVALKFLPDAFAADPERMARFEREAKLLASLNHPNIAAIYGLEQAEGKRFLVLELVEGETLAQRISKGPLPVEEALRICRQIAEGIEAAHEKGVIHRDLKPANVMIAAGDKVKILDFGLAKALSDETQSVDSSQSPTLTEAMTRPGVILGTAAYMSPEQAKGKSVDKRADIWAFGCILYECLTGKRAFEGETATETLASVLTREPEWEKIPAKARPLLRSCLEKLPSRRLRDIGDAWRQLDAAPESAPARPTRPWIAWTLALMLLIAFASLSFIHFFEKPSTSPELVRFQMGFQDNVKIGIATMLALSPDGRRLAFSGIGSDGIQRLWIRSFDWLEVQPLIGSESSSIVENCFWSPDSRFVAFATGGKLKKVDVSAGPARTICELMELGGGAWNSDGVIIFGDWNAGAIMRVAAGGVLSPLKKPDTKRQELYNAFPVFLPDGRHFIYFCFSNIAENVGLYIGSLDSNPETQNSKRLLESTGPASYLPPGSSYSGQLLFLRGETLMAQPFDDKRLELIGDPIAIAEHVGSIWNNSFFSVSTNGVLAYRPPINNQLTWIDRNGRESGAIGEPGDYLTFDLSRDAHRLVVSKTQLDGFRNLWVMDLLRNATATPLTIGKSEHADPRWSPDGDKVMFDTTDNTSNVLLQVSLPASNPVQVFKFDNTTCYLDDWSPDGKYLLYHSNVKPQVWALPLAGERKPVLVTRSLSGVLDQSRFSPDGRWIAYNTNESGRYEVNVVPFPPTGEKWQVSRSGGMQATWRSNGSEMYFLTPEATLMAVDIRAGKRFEWGDPHQLFKVQISTSSGTEQYAPDPEGKRFLFLKPAAESTTAPFNIILNWTSLLKK
jgi:eukaryotic-like serine/threonine-protein kinase